PGGVPLTTPSGGKSQIGRVALTTRTVEPEPDPEEELFGELDWETDSQLDFVVGRSNVQYDEIPPAPPAAVPAPPPPVASAPPTSLRAPSSAPLDFSDIPIDEAEPGPELRVHPSEQTCRTSAALRGPPRARHRAAAHTAARSPTGHARGHTPARAEDRPLADPGARRRRDPCRALRRLRGQAGGRRRPRQRR